MTFPFVFQKFFYFILEVYFILVSVNNILSEKFNFKTYKNITFTLLSHITFSPKQIILKQIAS